eukprot:TRINITY_DN38431_c0_g1_i1.p2 TRINITY_DN38431_c0_g1~~TRINITY_DN38431_c0_g1_i1.p2  ORF type:complete len:146 (+),score=13.16 TRINITY_DN38431_c0_g1_i1:429-866(+)
MHFHNRTADDEETDATHETVLSKCYVGNGLLRLRLSEGLSTPVSHLALDTLGYSSDKPYIPQMDRNSLIDSKACLRHMGVREALTKLSEVITDAWPVGKTGPSAAQQQLKLEEPAELTMEPFSPMQSLKNCIGDSGVDAWVVVYA